MSNPKVFQLRLLRKEDGFISFLFGLILVIIIFLTGLLFQFLTFSNPTDIKQLRGRGTEQTYDFSYSQVFEAATSVIYEKKLSVIESNGNKGYIIATENSEFFYEGRIIALFFSELSEDHTQVEVVSKFAALPPIKELIMPKNRPSQILSDIGSYLDKYNGIR